MDGAGALALHGGYQGEQALKALSSALGCVAMKPYPLVIGLLFAGHAMHPEANITTFGEITDAAGTNRLVLRTAERPLPNPRPGVRAYDFHALIWEIKDGDNWSEKFIITRVDFEKGVGRRRWIAELHSFDSTTGHAVVRIGEEQPPKADGSVRVEYSWREWDLLTNRQVQVLWVCKSPFETLEGKEPTRNKP